MTDTQIPIVKSIAEIDDVMARERLEGLSLPLLTSGFPCRNNGLHL